MHENAVDVVGTIQVFDDSEQIESAGGGWRRKERTGEADLLAGRDFTFYIELRRGVVADKNGGEAGTNASRGKQTNFVA